MNPSSCLAARVSNGLVLLSLALALAALAPPALAADSNWHIEARLGTSTLDAVFPDGRFSDVRNHRFDDDGTEIAAGVGYQVNRFLSLEAGYHDFGDFRGFGSLCPDGASCLERLATETGLCVEGFDCSLVEDPLRADLEGWSLSFLPSWPVTEHWTLFGRLGWLWADAEIRRDRAGTDPALELSESGLYAGFGLRRTFSSGLELFADYRYFELDLSATGVGIGWRF